MSASEKRKELASAWAALGLGAFAWFGSHQLGSDLTFVHCPGSGLVPVLLIGLVALVLTGLGAFLSYRVWKGAAPEGRSFAALVGMLVAGLLALAILLQTIAGLIIPSCFG